MASEREQIQQQLVEWLTKTDVFDAPYGILPGLQPWGSGKCRVVTFGVRVISDVVVFIYSPERFLIDDSRHGRSECGSLNEVKEVLKFHYRIGEQQ